MLDRIHKPGPGEAPQATVTDRSGHTYEEFDIVDGQQRLTTVVLMLDAIPRELATLPDLEPLHRLRLQHDRLLLTVSGFSLPTARTRA